MKVCGLDVHKDTIFCAIYNGKSFSKVEQYETMTNHIRQMGAYLQSKGVKRVAMESTGNYWVPVWDILLEMGFDLVLVNPYLIKQMPGRKSDVKDAQWIAELLYKGQIRASVVPSATIHQLRTYSRKYVKLQQQKTRSLQKIEQILVKSSIRISSCVSNLGNKSVLKVVSALVEGETDPVKLERLVFGNAANKSSGRLREALTGNMKEHHRMELQWEKEELELFERQTQDCLIQMEKICKEHYRKELDLIKTIPGVSTIAAMVIIAETGADMSVFETSGRLTGWAGLRPRNDETAGKCKSRAITKGNSRLKAILVQTAWAASRTKGSFFMKTFCRLAVRKSRKKALIAVARKMLVVVWHLLTEETAYNPAMALIYDPVSLQKKMHYHQTQMQKLEKLIRK